ncbi:hypothetical protein U1Q18_015402, partial [Sarracenia purpurea var. burkii]
MGSANRFSALVGFDEDNLDSVKGSLPRALKSQRKQEDDLVSEIAFQAICGDAVEARIELATFAKSLDRKSARAFLKTAKAIELEVNQAMALMPFDLAQMRVLEERIHLLKGLSPIKMETSSSGSGLVEAPMPKADPTSFGMKAMNGDNPSESVAKKIDDESEVTGSLPPIDVKTIVDRDHASNVSTVSIATEPLASKTEGEGSEVDGTIESEDGDESESNEASEEGSELGDEVKYREDASGSPLAEAGADVSSPLQ